MDEARFDRLGRAFDTLLTRRAAGVLTAATAVTALGLANAEAKKKKKKCKKPKVKCGKKCCAAGQVCRAGACAAAEECQITRTATLWTLEADCDVTRTIELPDGVTLDGDGKTISPAGTYASFNAAVIRNQSAGGEIAVRNLTIDVSNLTGLCPSPGSRFDGIVFSDCDGQIEDVTVSNLSCGSGIDVRTSGEGPRRAVALTNATVSNVEREVSDGGFSIIFNGRVDANMSGGGLSQISGDLGIWVTGGATATIDGVTIEDAYNGVIADIGQAVVRNSVLSNVAFGLGASGFMSTLEATGNTITGRGPGFPAGAGVTFSFGGAGSADGNTISNFRENIASVVSCGISIEDSAGDVTLGTNTFPDPPGNEQDVCDNRP